MELLGYKIDNELEFEVFKERALKALEDGIYQLIIKRTATELTQKEAENLKMVEDQLRELREVKFIQEHK